MIKRGRLEDITECDKCGSRWIYWMTTDHSHVLCTDCLIKMIDELERCGYNVVPGFGSYIRKLPRTMRLWTGDV